ncbi:MAG TPA: hypothetical protein VHY75_09105 [Steroidobacteraceae bacterium]|jgi:hypothetical protein|nr:hypothetical protein [Steroidobacteraceae bacterium]
MAAFSNFHFDESRVSDFKEAAARTGSAAAETALFAWTVIVLAFGALITAGFLSR